MLHNVLTLKNAMVELYFIGVSDKRRKEMQKIIANQLLERLRLAAKNKPAANEKMYSLLNFHQLNNLIL